MIGGQHGFSVCRGSRCFFAVHIRIPEATNHAGGMEVDHETRSSGSRCSAGESVAEKAEFGRVCDNANRSSATPRREQEHSWRRCVPVLRVGLNEEAADGHRICGGRVAQRLCSAGRPRDERSSPPLPVRRRRLAQSAVRTGLTASEARSIFSGMLSSKPPGEHDPLVTGQVRHRVARDRIRCRGQSARESGTTEAVDGWLEQLPTAHAAVCRFIYQRQVESEAASELGARSRALAAAPRGDHRADSR